MFPSFNPGHIGLSLNLEEGLDFAKRHGFEGHDPAFPEIARRAADGEEASRIRDAYASKGLKVGASNLPFMPYRVSEKEWREQLDGPLPRGIDALARIGGTRLCMWIMPGSNDLERDANFDFHVQRFKPIAAMAEERGVRLALEFIGPKTSLDRFKYPFIRDLSGIRKLAAAVGHKTGLLLDSWHWHTSGGSVADLETIQPGELVHVHINDAPKGLPLEEHIDNQRKMPCATGVIDLKAFMGMVIRVGYDGPVTAEPFDQEVNSLDDPDQAAAINAAAMRKAFELRQGRP